MTERKIIVPGETIVSGENYLPGDGAYRKGGDIVAMRYGLADVSDRFVKVIALSGVFSPRPGNIIIGQIVDITFNGWLVSYGGSSNGFLSMNEVLRYINKDEMSNFLDFGEVIMAKIYGVKGRGIDLSLKGRGLGKLEGGMIIKINANKVPRVIGKEGSMVRMIKESSVCDISVGQNGQVWIKGKNVDNELTAKKIIEFICENSYIDGLTEKTKDFIKNLGERKDGS